MNILDLPKSVLKVKDDGNDNNDGGDNDDDDICVI